MDDFDMNFSPASLLHEIPIDVLRNMFSYLGENRVSKSLVGLNKHMQEVLDISVKDNTTWKSMTEVLIGWYIPEHTTMNWKMVYNNLSTSCAKMDPSIYSQTCFTTVCREGYLEIVRLLIDDERVNPSEDNNLALITATIHGYPEIVKLMLYNNRFHITHRCTNHILRVAVKNNQADVLKVLLDVSNMPFSFDPSTDNNKIVDIAAEENSIDCIKLLLADIRVKLTNTTALNEAINKCNVDVVLLLLPKTPGIGQADKITILGVFALKCCAYGVGRLLDGLKIDPSADDNNCMRLAAMGGSLDVIKLLLSRKQSPGHGQINPAVGLAFAANTDVIKLLLGDERTDPTTPMINALKQGERKASLIEILLGHPRVPLAIKMENTIVILPEDIVMLSLNELLNLLDQSVEISQYLTLKYFWWMRLELLHGISPYDYDVNEDPLKLCLAIETSLGNL